MLVNLFDIKFNPKHSDNNCDVIKDKLNNYLVTVEMSSEDKVLRNMLGIVNAITRTNYYQPHKYIFSFKFDSSKVPDLPKPVPFAEAFVYSRNFEAVHLEAVPYHVEGLDGRIEQKIIGLRSLGL